MKSRLDSALGGGSLQTRFSHTIQRGKILAPPGARDCPNRNTMFIENALAKMIHCPWRRYVALFFCRLPFYENTILWFSFFNGCHAFLLICVILYVKNILLISDTPLKLKFHSSFFWKTLVNIFTQSKKSVENKHEYTASPLLCLPLTNSKTLWQMQNCCILLKGMPTKAPRHAQNRL